MAEPIPHPQPGVRAIGSTLVTFVGGDTRGEATVVFATSVQDGCVIVVDRTPFHPVDHTWPDQPGDAGVMRTDDDSVIVSEALMVAMDEDGTVSIGDEIPVKRGAEGWTWMVGHRVEGSEVPAWSMPGAEVLLEVDATRRAGLSRGHTACHLASLALDLAVADLWRKDPGVDALGNPNFERRANQSSRIHEDGSVDEYRLGKSLRKAGFDSETFLATLSQREERINDQLAAWVASGSTSRIVADGPAVTDRRSWTCDLPEGTVEILCGGTHVESLSEFASISVALDLSDPRLLVMTTRLVASSAEPS